MNPLKRLFSIIQQNNKEIVSIYFYASLNGLLDLSVPLGVQAIVGLFTGATMVTSIYILIGLVVIGVLFSGVVKINQYRIIERIQQKIFYNYSIEFATKLPRIDLQKNNPLFMPERVNRFFDVINVQKGFAKILLDIPFATIQILFSLLVLSFYNAAFIGVGLTLVIILYLIFYFTFDKGMKENIIESKYKYKLVDWLENVSRALPSFKYEKQDEISLKKINKNLEGWLEARNNHFQTLMTQYRSMVGANVFITLSLFVVGTYLLVEQELNIGEFVSGEILILMIVKSVEKIISSIDMLYDVGTGLEKIADVVEAEEETPGSLILSKDTRSLEIEARDLDIHFENNGIQTKTNLNFKVKEGEKVLFIGKENSGKRTLMNLLTGKYRKYEGHLTINKNPYENYDLKDFRCISGFIPNFPDIFPGNLFENISLGRDDVKEDEIIKLSEEIGFNNFLDDYENDFLTELVQNNTRTNNTKIKKILYLRALSNNPKILIIEEPWLYLSEEESKGVYTYLMARKDLTVFLFDCKKSFKFDQEIQLKDNIE